MNGHGHGLPAPDSPRSDAVDARVQREKEFADAPPARFARVRKWIYRAIGAFDRSGEMYREYDPKDKVVLDYGCGEGSLSYRLVQKGRARRAVGIDVSPNRLSKAKRGAVERGIGDRTHFLVVDAHRSGFADDTFDLVVGRSILHHLDLERALPELRRIIKPGGRAVFQEPLWHNPLLRIGRRFTPSARTADEHPLTVRDWELCARTFSNFRHYEREFLTIPFMPLNLLLPRRAQEALAKRLGRVDDRLLQRFPRLRKHGRITILILE